MTDQEEIPEDALADIKDRYHKDPSLDVYEELKKVVSKPEGIAFLDDCEKRRQGLNQRYFDVMRQHTQIQATPETGDAITSYHQGVVEPLLKALLEELHSVQLELAMIHLVRETSTNSE